MTTQEAYIQGFCKAAEAHGVDPEELVKTAQAVKTALKGISPIEKLVSPVLGWLGGMRGARMAARAGASATDVARARQLGRAAGRSLFGRAVQARLAATNLANKGVVLTPNIVDPGPTKGLISPLFRENLPRMERFNNAVAYLSSPKGVDAITKRLYKGLPLVG